MENIINNNSSDLSEVGIGNDESASNEKIKRAYEYYDSGRINEAISLIEKDSRLLANSHAQLILGNCYHKANDTQKSLFHWKKAIDISPLEHTAYINIGNEL